MEGTEVTSPRLEWTWEVPRHSKEGSVAGAY